MFNRSEKHLLSPPLGRAGAAFFAVAILAVPVSAAWSQEGGIPRPAAVVSDWTAVDLAIGRVGTPQPGGIQRYSFPRGDLKVMVGDVAIKPSLALGSWVAFKRLGADESIVMGDLVLLQEEVTGVVAKLQELGVDQTALHNHLQGESPRVMYLHIEAHGDPMKIGQAVKAALALTKTPAAVSSSSPAPFPLDTVELVAGLGHRGKVTGGVYQVSVPRSETIRMHGVEIPPAMGVATAINFQPTEGGKAAITGDFVLLAEEVNLVIEHLAKAGIAVTAVHSHMLGEEPRLYFLHFWANDNAVKLAHGLRAALGLTKSKGS